jgi:PAS domain S-box-containing protein
MIRPIINEAQITAIFDNSPTILMLFDRSGHLLRLNNLARNLLGITDELMPESSINELLKCSLSNPIPAICDKDHLCKNCELVEAFWDTASSGIRHNIHNIKSDALCSRSPRGIYLKATTARLELGNEFLLIISMEDVTEFIHLEEGLRRAEMLKSLELYQTLFENANDAIFIMRDYTFIECNSKTLKMYGCSRDQIIGKPPSYFSPEFQPDGRNSLDKAVEKMQAALNGNPQIFEWLHCRLDRTPFYAEVSLNHIPSLGKTALQAIVRDITERKMAESALKESEEKFRRIAERAFDVIVTVTPDGTLTYISPSVERIFGYKPDQLLGKNAFMFVKESEVFEITELFKQVSLGKYIEGKRLHLRKADNTWANIEINAVPIYKNDSICGAQGIIRDVTETKRLQELESRAQRLETAGKIAGQVAHDFNNLLGPLVAYPELIREMLPENHPARTFIDDMETASNKIANLNQQLLTLSRRGHYNQEVFNINPLIKQAVKDMGKLPESLTIELDLASDLLNIKGGNAQVYRVIMNVLTNARDAVGNTGKISIKTENVYIDKTLIGYSRVQKGEFVKVAIADTGNGIPPENIQKIFDPFFTTKTTDKIRGSGLGLSVVDAVMKDHGGYIDLKSNVGQGTVLYLYFPTTHEVALEQIDAEIAGGSESIMVVDDDDMQRTVLNNLLGRLGYKVSTCESGEQALEILKNNPHDLLILDMVMPEGIDGAETFRRALIINPAQKAIIVSGFSETSRIREARAIGASAFVKKPLNMKSLASAVRKALDTAKVTSTLQKVYGD